MGDCNEMPFSRLAMESFSAMVGDSVLVSSVY